MLRLAKKPPLFVLYFQCLTTCSLFAGQKVGKQKLESETFGLWLDQSSPVGVSIHQRKSWQFPRLLIRLICFYETLKFQNPRSRPQKHDHQSRASWNWGFGPFFWRQQGINSFTFLGQFSLTGFCQNNCWLSKTSEFEPHKISVSVDKLAAWSFIFHKQ